MEIVERVIVYPSCLKSPCHRAFQLLACQPNRSSAIVATDAEPDGKVADKGGGQVGQHDVTDLQGIRYVRCNAVTHLHVPDIGALRAVNANAVLHLLQIIVEHLKQRFVTRLAGGILFVCHFCIYYL